LVRKAADAVADEQAAGAAGEAQASLDGVDLEALTVPKLKDLLVARGLKVAGRKAELIERLKEADKSGSPLPTPIAPCLVPMVVPYRACSARAPSSFSGRWRRPSKAT